MPYLLRLLLPVSQVLLSVIQERFFLFLVSLVIIGLIQLGGLGLMLFATLFSVALGRRINLQDRMLIQPHSTRMI